MYGLSFTDRGLEFDTQAGRGSGGLIASEKIYTWVVPPETTFSLVHSSHSTLNLFIREVLAPSKKGTPDSTLLRWEGRILPMTLVTTLGSYLVHESGHIHDIFHAPEAADVDSGGINTSLWASQALLSEPHEGLMSDFAYTVHKFDLPLYPLISESIAKLLELKGAGDLS